ncbi:PAAR domain-containing protein [Vibrio crassostreae]|uniref:PAAR domain-containing protein n=1 Tax=Vibrio crassostreae TaxID=246167 RepID=UPI0010DA775F|nr:PAAR domain-containing protein [Vibrio crassostreae]TCT59018.1 PAAR motif-containing protein [Vibrio crassostreae]
MLNNAITVGTQTSTGGKVLTGSAGVKINNLDVSVVGDQATCTCGAKSCRGVGPILQGSPRNIKVGNKLIAMKDDPVDTGCGNCFLLSSGDGVSLGAQTSGSINMGGGVNIGQGLNINMGSGVSFGQGVSFGGSSADVASSQSLASSTQPSVAGQKAASTVGVNPNNMHWPPYNFLAKEGDKEIHVRYTQDVVETTVLAPEEWKEFFDALDKTKNIGGALKGTYDAFDTAKQLGGLGVTAYVKTHNGVDYLILKGYKQHMKTLLAGNRFKASNPQVVKLGLGALDSVKGMARYVKVTAPMEILVGSAINVLQYVLNDEYTLRQLGVDQTKLLISVFSSSALAAGVAGILVVTSIPITFAAGTIIIVGSSFTVWAVDQTTDFQDKIVEAAIEYFD